MSILALTSNTLVSPAVAGQIEYNGQFHATDSNASRAQMQRLVLETSKASTSGTSIDFTGIPAWAKRITVMFMGVSMTGTSGLIVRLGTSSGIVSTGYLQNNGYVFSNTSYTAAGTDSTSIAYMDVNTAAQAKTGQVVLTNVTGNTWLSSIAVCATSGTGQFTFGSGTITLSGTLDRVRVTTFNGTDAFDSGTINILYEG